VSARRLRRALALTWLAAATALAVQPACARQADAGAEPAEGRALLRAGKYDEAAASFAAAADRSAAAARGLVRTLLEVGRLADAEAAAQAGVARHGAELETSLGLVLRAAGRRPEADAAFERAVAGGARDANTARLERAVLLRERGERAAAESAFDAFFDIYNAGGRLGAEDLVAVARAVWYLGDTDSDLFRDALRALDEAAAADPSWHEPRVLLGDLFLEKYNSEQAQEEYERVLRENPTHPRALFGMGRAQIFDGNPAGQALIRMSLEYNPSLVAARAFLARLHLAMEDWAAGFAELDRAAEVDADAAEVRATRAAFHLLRGERAEYEALRRAALAHNPIDADFHTTVAELAVLQRRYTEAVELAQEAVRVDPRSWRAWGVLGMNEMRIGRAEEARRSLTTSFEGDPYNVWIKNTLDLLDTYPQYVTVETPRFEFFLHRDEAELLAPYMEALAEEAYDRLAERYGVRPEPPIRVEVFPRSADFSVRTLGLPGLGALGVAFGRTLAMDSPGARDLGSFNWAATLWHEIAHTFTLEASRNRVPRWVTEGLSVLEERRAREGWGSAPSLAFLAAYRTGRLLPVSSLNMGFTSPDYPELVPFSYYQASLVMEMIERDHGIAAIRAMLRAYGEGRENEAVVREVLRVDMPTLDARFDAYMKERFGRALDALPMQRLMDRGPAGLLGSADVENAAPDDYIAQIVMGRRLLEVGHVDEAIRHLERAGALFPDNAAPDGAWDFLARAYRMKDDTEREAEALRRLTALQESNYMANTRLAELRRAAGDAAGERAALERAVWISPFDPDVHTRLAELHRDAGDHAAAVRERRAVVALRPVDRAEALYQLALAEFEAGQREAARRSVLRALEIAPGYERAQELLLRISGEGR
jgi:cellulose synthase operon protein C